MVEKMKKIIKYLLLFIIIPVIIASGLIFFKDRQYGILSLLVAVLACIPFLVSFEMRKPEAKELIIIAVIIAINVVGRISFAAIPHFKPVAAIIIIAALSFGSEAGFMIGALTAVLSNIYFGQGPWTPFQMFAWGMIGFLVGFFKDKKITRSIYFISLLGIIFGIFYTLFIEIWTVITVESGFSLYRYFTTVKLSLPIMLIYIISDVIFIILLANPIGKKLERIKNKYGLFNKNNV